ncbi:hypothetical protein RI065_04690 [Mycoplasmatota bacterium zrk1]
MKKILILVMLFLAGCKEKIIYVEVPGETVYVEVPVLNPSISYDRLDTVAREFLDVYFNIDEFDLKNCDTDEQNCLTYNHNKINIKLSPFVSDGFLENIKVDVESSNDYYAHILVFFSNNDEVILLEVETCSLIGEGGIGRGIDFDFELNVNGEPVKGDGFFWLDADYKINSMRMRFPDQYNP